MENSKVYHDLLFDADETLFDFAACEEQAFFRSAEKMGVLVDRDIYRLYSSINDRLWKAHERGEIGREDILRRRYAELLNALGRDPRDGSRWNGVYEQELAQSAILFDDTVAVCTALSKKYRLSIVTNGLVHVQKSRMERSGIGGLFAGVFISGEIGYAKPDIRFFEAVERLLPDFDRKKALLIGDSLTGDMEGARRAGIDCILMDRRGLHPKGCPFALGRVSDLDTLCRRLLPDAAVNLSD